MFSNIIGAVITAAVGFLIALLNFIFSKWVLQKKPDKIPTAFIGRQLLQVAYLVLVYLVGSRVKNIDIVFLLVGAAVGMTIPMFFFTRKLLAFNDAEPVKKTGKEDEHDG